MQLLTINDLTAPDNDWKQLLDHAAYLQVLFETYRKSVITSRKFEVFLPGDEERAPGLHASELALCTRQATYTMLGTQKGDRGDDINMMMRFDLGTVLHALMQSEFGAMCKFTGDRVTFKPEVPISGVTSEIAREYNLRSSADGLFVFYDETGRPYLRVLLEIKSESGPEWEKLNCPREKHVLQTTLYQAALDAPLVWFLYYNKSNSNYTGPKAPWLVPFDMNTWRLVADRAQLVHRKSALVDRAQDIRTADLPNREEGRHCTWCPYVRHCEPAYTKYALSRGAAPKPRKLT